METLVPQRKGRWRIAALAAIAGIVLIVIVRGRGGGPIPLAVVVKTATNGSFYHWRDFDHAGSLLFLRAEGWCALRRSRTLSYLGELPPGEERRSPSGIYRKAKGHPGTFEPRADVVGMEMGRDFLTGKAAQLSGHEVRLTPLGDNRWQGGSAIYRLEPRTYRILSIEAPGEHIEIDYPLALSSDLFEAPR